MRKPTILAAAASLAALLAVTSCQKSASDQPQSSTGPASNVAFSQVQTIFNQNCTRCHGGARPKGRIDLTTYEGVIRGGEDGSIVKAGDPAQSILVQALRGTNRRKQMPMRAGRLPEDQIKLVEGWIASGAKAN